MTAAASYIEEQNEALSERDIGSLRWRAIEAANCAPDLSPVARRVLTILICKMDGKTRACFPSELNIAESLGIHIVSVKKAKAELRDEHKLIHWTNPGGPRHLSHYIFNWDKLIRLSDEAKSQGKEAVSKRKAEKAPKGSRAATIGTQRNGSHTTTIEPVTRDENQAPKVANSHSEVAVSLLQGSQMATPVVAASLPEHPYIIPAVSSQREHDERGPARPDGAGAPVEARRGGDRRSDQPSANLQVASQAEPGAGKEALEGKATPPPPPRPRCPYPKLVEAFSDMPTALEALYRLDADGQMTAAKILATKKNGKLAAAAYVAGQARQ